MVPCRIAYALKIFPKLSETFIIGELAELKRRGIELLILSLLPPREEPHHQLVTRAGLDEIVAYDIKTFSTLIGKFRPQLVHAHFATESTALARELASTQSVPFTFTAHGYDIFRKPPPDFYARANAAAAIVTVSQANAHYINKTFGVPLSHLRVIPCGVDTTRFCPANGEASAEDAPLIVCVARLVAVKNLGLLLRGCALVRDAGLRFRCVLAGDGPCRSELEAVRAKLGLEEVVDMPGAAEQDQVLKWWRRATVGVLTSDNEGMPVCLMEAAACGVPVVATAVGGVPELVQDGLTGLLIQAGDAGALATALKRLLSDRQMRLQMSAAARQRARLNFSVVRQADQLLALWSEILAERLL
jgi:glycosyltransferase involved in cell wall biosynthesis